MGKKPHISLNHFAQIHGPLLSVKLGTQLLVVASSPAAARGILKTHDRQLSARHLIKASVPDLNPFSLVLAPECRDQWTLLRTLCRTELFSPKALESQSSLRERKVGQMVDFLLSTDEGNVVNIGEAVFATVFNTLSNIFFSKDFVDIKDHASSGLKEKIRKMMELGGAPNISEFYPVLDRFDLQGIRKKALQYTNEAFSVWEPIIKERRGIQLEGHKVLIREEDFLDVMLARGLPDNQINQLVLELLSAGTDTTTATIEWAMAELVKNNEAMDKVRQELKTKITANSVIIKESDISQLPYLNACVKETLRLHPTVPFLVPHRALVACEVMNYTIPKDTEIIVNVWAIGRDPNNWEDPLTFKPERFISTNSSLDFRGQDFEFIPFGAGRRMCPGLPLASRSVHLIIASLIHHFEWLLPDNQDASQVDMNDKFGITLHKEQPLLLIPIKRSL